MADGILESLQELFINNGARINPGDDLFFRTFELEEGQKAPFLNVLRETVNDLNSNPQQKNRKFCLSPIYDDIIHLFHKLEFVWKYFCGEFEIRCQDRYFREQFARVWPEFIRGWYFGHIYVGYGQDFEDIDREAVERRGENFDLDYVTGRFRLYSKAASGRFHSIYAKQSNIQFTPEQQRRLVRCESTPMGCNHWIYWWYLWIEMLDDLDRYRNSVRALSKKVILTPKDNAEKENILQQMFDKGTIVSRASNQIFNEADGNDKFSIGKTKVEPLEFMNNDTPSRIFEGIMKYFEFNAAHLGFAGEHNEQKKERLTAAENWPKQKTVSNVRTFLINSLNKCFDEMRYKFGDKVVPMDLKIVPSNQAFAQGLPQQQFNGTFNDTWQPNKQFQQEEQFRGND